MRKLAYLAVIVSTTLAGCTDEDSRMAASLLLSAADGYTKGYNNSRTTRVYNTPRVRPVYNPGYSSVVPVDVTTSTYNRPTYGTGVGSTYNLGPSSVVPVDVTADTYKRPTYGTGKYRCIGEGLYCGTK